MTLEFSANKFISALVKNLQAVCHGNFDFDDNVKVVGHLYLTVDSCNEFNYILNEKVTKSDKSSTTFVSKSFYATDQQQLKTPKKIQDESLPSSDSRQEARVNLTVDLIDSNQMYLQKSRCTPTKRANYTQNESQFNLNAKQRKLSLSSPDTPRTCFNVDSEIPTAFVCPGPEGKNVERRVPRLDFEDNQNELHANSGFNTVQFKREFDSSTGVHVTPTEKAQHTLGVPSMDSSDIDLSRMKQEADTETKEIFFTSKASEEVNEDGDEIFFTRLREQTENLYPHAELHEVEERNYNNINQLSTLPNLPAFKSEMASSEKKARPKTLKYTEEAMQAACNAVCEGKKKLREAARLHGVPPSTLKDRLRGRKPFHEVERTVITAKEEERLAEWMKECARRGFGRTMGQVKRAVQSILNQRTAVTVFKDNLPGKKWVSLFLQRHKDVTLRMPQGLGAQRAAVTEAKLRSWFERAAKEIKEAGGDVLDHPSRIFNCDESGFQLGGGGFCKVVAGKEDKRVYQVTSDTHTQITVLACGSASGEVLNPLIIFPGQRFSYDPLEGFPEAHFGKSKNGWIDGEIFFGWLKDGFIPATQHLPRPILLFADGHRTHLTLAVSELCRDHGIILYLLPSHASHVVQPLDLTTFKLLKQVWREEVLKFQEENCDTVGKREFSGVLKKAWERGIKNDVMISGFRAAGLYPWNPDHVDMTKLGPCQLYSTGPDETQTTGRATETTETDVPTATPATVTDVPTATPATVTDVPTATPATVTDVTETVTDLTGTYNVIVTATADMHDDLPDHPSSPTTCFLLPPFPLPSTSTDISVTDISVTDISVSDISVTDPFSASIDNISSATVTSTLPSSSQLPSSSNSSVASSSFSSSLTDNMETKQAVDRLLDLTAKAGLDKLVRYRTIHSLGLDSDDPEERLFCLLYSKLTSQTEGRTFDTLPLPSRWQKKKTALQPPKMVSSDAFRQYVSDVETKKRKLEEDKEKKKKDREEKKKRMEEDKEKKRKERDLKKKEREEKKAQKEKKKFVKGVK